MRSMLLLATLGLLTVTAIPVVEAQPQICAGAWVATDGSVRGGPIVGCGGVACGYGAMCIHCWIMPRTGQCTAS